MSNFIHFSAVTPYQVTNLFSHFHPDIVVYVAKYVSSPFWTFCHPPQYSNVCRLVSISSLGDARGKFKGLFLTSPNSSK